MPRGYLNFSILSSPTISYRSPIKSFQPIYRVFTIPSIERFNFNYRVFSRLSSWWSKSKVLFKLVLFAFKALVKFASLTPKIASNAVFNLAAVDIMTGGTRVEDPGGEIGKGILDRSNVFKTCCIAINKGSGSVGGK